MNAESRKRALHYFFEKVVGPLGFKFTPDTELKDFLLEQEVILESKHGIPFCPCQPIRHDRERDMQIVSMHSLPPETFRRDQTLLVRPLRPQGCHRPGQPTPTAAKGGGS